MEGSKALREYQITAGKIQTGGGRGRREIADYVLEYKGIKLAVIEAKSSLCEVDEGVMEETQRIGIVPDIEVKPTIQGTREGRHELMEKAVELINKP